MKSERARGDWITSMYEVRFGLGQCFLAHHDTCVVVVWYHDLLGHSEAEWPVGLQLLGWRGSPARDRSNERQEGYFGLLGALNPHSSFILLLHMECVARCFCSLCGIYAWNECSI